MNFRWNALLLAGLLAACAQNPTLPDCQPAESAECKARQQAEDSQRKVADIKAELAAINSQIAAGRLSDAERLQLYDQRDRLLEQLHKLQR